MDASERRTRASADAAEWWLRLQSNDLGRAEREQYVTWLRESALHVAEMLRIARVHNALERFDRWTNIRTDGATDEKILEFPGDPSEPSPNIAALPKEWATLPAWSEG